jgi:hypothetical protein
MKTKVLSWVLSTLLAVVASSALAWGPEGHTVIARVAAAKLSTQAAADMQWIISVGVPALNARMPGGKCQIDPANPLGASPRLHDRPRRSHQPRQLARLLASSHPQHRALAFRRHPARRYS